ncbi:MAG: uracil phosphoribosyltransferase [Clostridia bacterium]|nr:uracil phosphoribosyltransferase [Clostridia bacterium]
MANYTFSTNPKFHHVKHPLIEHKLALLRDINTTTKQFMELAEEIAMLLTYEATKDLPLEEVTVETPLERAQCHMVSGKAVGIVPILRAGLGMVSGVQKLIPNAKVGHIGLYRDHDTHEPVEYYCKLPADAEQRTLLVVDPMLATGGSASDAIAMIKKRGVTKIKLCCIVSAPEGVQKVLDDHPDVDLYVAALDRCLNENCYILPGLGDAGDRLFGTK